MIKVWEARSASVRNTLSGAVQSVMCVAFSPNDELILGGSNDNTVRLWNIQYGRVRVSFLPTLTYTHTHANHRNVFVVV